MGYFIFKGVNSRDYGVLEQSPMPPKAMQTQKTIAIPNRVEPLFEDSREFSPITINAVLGITDKSKIDGIYGWLHGEGDLIFSNDLGKYYKATCYSEIMPQYMSARFGKIPIKFLCKPFRYAVENEPITLTSAQTLNVGGSYPCEPVYKIYGTGDIDFIVNGEVLEIKDVSEHIVIDTSRLIAYKGDTVLVNKTIGQYPMLGVGDNSISWTGTVTKVEITKNERWL